MTDTDARRVLIQALLDTSRWSLRWKLRLVWCVLRGRVKV